MGFRLHFKWGFPLHSPHLPKSPFKPSPCSFTGQEASVYSGVTLPPVNSGGIEKSCNYTLKAYAYSTALQTLENGYSEMEETRMNVPKTICTGSQSVKVDAWGLVGDKKSTIPEIIKSQKKSHLDLLMENLYILEATFAKPNLVMLETDILIQLGRLGALNLFHTCLSRSLQTSTDRNLFFAPSELNAVIRSGKKEERKGRRMRALKKTDKICGISMPSKHIRKGRTKLTVSSARRPLSSKRRRLPIAKNETELSTGVKAVVDLEILRTTLEKECGHVVSFSTWADAAGVETKVLQQHLLFGWSCRDDLVRSTQSLIFYLARNYRGTGIAFEDLLQAGKLGVLKGMERFDPTRGYRFSTYVQYWIRKSMATLVTKHARGIYVPVTLSSAINKIHKARKTLSQSHGKYPDDNEIAKLTGLSLPTIQSASKCFRVVGSIDQQVGVFPKYMECTSDSSMESPEESVMRQHMRRDISELLESLNLRERHILALRYGLGVGDHRPKSLEEVGSICSVSKEWIRKLQKKALIKLRDEEAYRNLNYYIDS